MLTTSPEEMTATAKEQLESALKALAEGRVDNLMIMVNCNAWWMGNPFTVLGWIAHFADVVKGQIWSYLMQRLVNNQGPNDPVSSDQMVH